MDTAGRTQRIPATVDPVWQKSGNIAAATTLRYPITPMRPSLILDAHRSAVRTIALRHRVRDIRVFGSVLHGADVEGSDIDLLVEPTRDTTLMDIAAIQVTLERLLGVGVDVLTPNALPEKFRARVLSEALPV